MLVQPHINTTLDDHFSVFKYLIFPHNVELKNYEEKNKNRAYGKHQRFKRVRTIANNSQ